MVEYSGGLLLLCLLRLLLLLLLGRVLACNTLRRGRLLLRLNSLRGERLLLRRVLGLDLLRVLLVRLRWGENDTQARTGFHTLNQNTS